MKSLTYMYGLWKYSILFKNQSLCNIFELWFTCDKLQLNVVSTIQGEETCCQVKTVGGVEYELVDLDTGRTKYYGCKDGCIYERWHNIDNRGFGEMVIPKM